MHDSDDQVTSWRGSGVVADATPAGTPPGHTDPAAADTDVADPAVAGPDVADTDVARAATDRREGWPAVVWLGVAGAGIVGAVGAKAVAAAVRDTAFANLTLLPQGQSQMYRLLAVVLVVALAGGLTVPRPWSGWPLAAAGSAAVFACTYGDTRTSTWYVFGFVVGAGAALAGTLGAIAGTGVGVHRRVLGAALAVGFVAAGELTRLTHWGNVVAKDALGATAVTVALSAFALVNRRSAGTSEPAAAVTGGRFGWLRRGPALLALAAVAVLVLDEALRRVDLGLRHGRGLTPRRYQAVELVTHYGHVAIVAAVTGVLVVVAWRSGGYAQARWIALGAGLAALLYSGPDALGDLALSPLGGWATVALPAAAAAGAAVMWYVRGSLPWDAYALVIGALATVVASALPDTAGTQHNSTALSHVGLVAFAVALGAGLAETAGAAPAAAPWSGAAGLAAGFGAFVLTGAQFAVDPLLNLNLTDRGSMYGAAVAVACAVAAWAVAVRGARRAARLDVAGLPG